MYFQKYPYFLVFGITRKKWNVIGIQLIDQNQSATNSWIE